MQVYSKEAFALNTAEHEVIKPLAPLMAEYAASMQLNLETMQGSLFERATLAFVNETTVNRHGDRVVVAFAGVYGALCVQDIVEEAMPFADFVAEVDLAVKKQKLECLCKSLDESATWLAAKPEPEYPDQDTAKGLLHHLLMEVAPTQMAGLEG